MSRSTIGSTVAIDLAVAHAQAVRRVVEQLVAARLRLEAHGEGAVACNVDARHMVHLDRDIPDLHHLYSLLDFRTDVGRRAFERNGKSGGIGPPIRLNVRLIGGSEKT